MWLRLGAVEISQLQLEVVYQYCIVLCCISVSVRVQKEDIYLHPDLEISDIYSLLTVIILTILDVLDIFHGRKNVRLGVKGNPVVY